VVGDNCELMRAVPLGRGQGNNSALGFGQIRPSFGYITLNDTKSKSVMIILEDVSWTFLRFSSKRLVRGLGSGRQSCMPSRLAAQTHSGSAAGIPANPGE
jgi:hypothetical protein